MFRLTLASLLVLATGLATSFALPCPARAEGLLDVHSHAIVPVFRDYADAHGAAQEETFPLPAWDVERHLAFMDKMGIETSVLTLPAPLPSYGDRHKTREIVRKANRAFHDIRARYPGRFLFCASLPLPDVEGALDEARYALEELRADGIRLATNSRGLYLGDPALDPVMRYLDSVHAVVILHPHRPDPVNEATTMATPLAVYEYPAETTRAIVNMLAHDAFRRFPNIRYVVPHCGSFLPLALPRIKSLLPALAQRGLFPDVDLEASLKQLYFDLAGAPTPEVVQTLLSITSPDHLLYGTDYPYVPDSALEKIPAGLGQTLEEAGMEKDRVFFGNARELFAGSRAAQKLTVAQERTNTAGNPGKEQNT